VYIQAPFTRLTHGFSQKIDKHIAMVAIHTVHYNFAGIHKQPLSCRIAFAVEKELAALLEAQ
jgi:hypothetical protein